MVGDTLDFWRVEVFEPDRRLRLAAEMKLPGRAWLEFEVEPVVRSSKAVEDGVLAARCFLRQTAIFDPVGLSGLVYWYALYPIHKAIFAGMLRRIAAIARSTGAPSWLVPCRGVCCPDRLGAGSRRNQGLAHR